MEEVVAENLILDKFTLTERVGSFRCDSCRDWCDEVVEIIDRDEPNRFDRICKDCLYAFFFDEEEYFFGDE